MTTKTPISTICIRNDSMIVYGFLVLPTPSTNVCSNMVSLFSASPLSELEYLNPQLVVSTLNQGSGAFYAAWNCGPIQRLTSYNKESASGKPSGLCGPNFVI